MSNDATAVTRLDLRSDRGHPAPPELQERRRAAEALMSGRPTAADVEIVEADAGGVPVLDIRRHAMADRAVVLYFHGGGYRLGSARAFAGFAAHVAAACRTRVLSVDYRLAPEHPFPAAIADAATAYRWLLDTGVSPGSIVVGGDSAGGGLAAALLLHVASTGLPTPAGAALLSPWVDLRNGASSYTTCAATDELFSQSAADEAAATYLAGRPATDPLASPALGAWHGQPPLLIQASDREVLRDDAALLARTARAVGVDVDHEVYPDVPHIWHLNYPALPAAVRAVDRLAAFIEKITAR